MKTRKILVKLSALVLLLVFLLSIGIGCSNNQTSNDPKPSNDNQTSDNNQGSDSDSSSDDEEIVLTVWAWDDNFNIPVMQKAGEYYKEVNPNVSVDVLSLSKEDVYTKLQTSLAGGGKGLPDIVLLEDYVSGKFLGTFKGSFADLTDEIDYSDFIDFKVEAISYDGVKYGIPFDTGATSLFYRLDLIEEAGYTEEDMNDITWDEYIEIGKAVKEKTGVFMTVEIASNMTSTIRTMMQSAGQWYFDQNGEINMKDNEALREGLNVLKRMKDEGILFEAESTGDRAGALNKGDVASIVNGPWFVATLKAAEDQKGLWRVASTPRLSSVDSINASNVGGSSWYVMENSANKDAAIDLFREIFTGNLDFYKDILVDQGALTGYRPALEGEVFETEDEFFGGQKIFKSFADTLSKVPRVNYGGYVAEANDAINSVSLDFLNGRISIDEALEQAENQLRNQLNR